MFGNFRLSGRARDLTMAAVPLLMAGIGGEAAAYTVPSGLGGGSTGVAEAGFPDFHNLSSLKFQRLSTGEYRLTAIGSDAYTFNTGSNASQSFVVRDASFRLTANFNTDLTFNPTGSAVDISGKIPGYNGTATQKAYSYSGSYNVTNKVGNLFHANLLNSGIDASPSALGFTTSAADDTGWASQFMSSNESVWFYSSSLWKTIQTAIATRSGKTWSITLDNVHTVTTVPVPAALWLFGSALLGMGGMARRRAAV